MKVVIKSVLECATDLYKFVLLPPSLENTRKKRKTQARKLENGPDLPIRKKKRYRRRPMPIQSQQTKDGWAVSTNEQKGIYYATKVTEDEITDVECYEEPVNTNPSPEVPEDDKARISELEKQLEELKKSLSSFQSQPPPPPASAYTNLPPPPPPIALQPKAVLSMPRLDDTNMFTPCYDSPCAPVTVPAPDFDQIQQENPKPLALPLPTPPPPPPPPMCKSETITDTQLVRVVPSGLHRTQSITDLIKSGEASKSVLRKVEVTRSPGGTPVKAPAPENFLAKALRLKFRVCY